MPEMKGIIPGSFYQLFGEEQYLGSRCLIIWGAQREHCVRGQICSVAGSIWWCDAYLQANEMPGGVTVICYHPPPPGHPPSTTDISRLFMRGAEPGGLAAHQIWGARRGQPRQAPSQPRLFQQPCSSHTCMHTLIHTHTHTRKRRQDADKTSLIHTHSFTYQKGHSLSKRSEPSSARSLILLFACICIQD